MGAAKRAVDGVAALVTHVLCRLDAQQVEKVPESGPLILVTNHINSLEILVLRSQKRLRNAIGLAKAEAWDNKILGWLLDLWEAIPIRRGEPDIGALRRSLDALDNGRILGLAPEGTRSGHGRLQRGHPGMTMIALKSGAPLLPLVFHGGESFRRNVSHLRRTPFHIMVGDPFHIDLGSAKATREVRQHVTDEIMYQLAALLPPAYRGVYADLSAATDRYLRFDPPARSNLDRPSASAP